MKSKKHNFKHPDPEKENLQPKSSSPKNKPPKTVTDDDLRLIKEDLKKSVTTISIFVLILIAFYFLNNKYNFLETIKNIKL